METEYKDRTETAGREKRTFGEKLAALRKGNGMSQEDLAAEVSVSRQAVSRWESGETMPDAENIVKLSGLFHVSTDFLLLEGEERQIQSGWPEGNMEPDARQQADPTAAGEGEYPASPQIHAAKRKNKLHPAEIAGIITGGIGALGMLVLWVLSTMLVSFESVESVKPAPPGGVGEIEIVNQYGYEFRNFIECYHLKALVWIFCIALAGGILLFAAGMWKRRHA